MRKRKRISQSLLLPLLAIALLISACGVQEAADDTPLVVATTSIIGDIAANVVGEEAQVEVLIPLGVDSHEFSPSAQQATLLADADLVVANGLGLEQGLEEVLDSTATDGVQVLELAPLVDPIPFTAPENHHEEDEAEEEDKEHDRLDPHFWNDPVRVGRAAVALAAELAQPLPDGAWEDNAEEYAALMESVDASIQMMVEDVPETARKLVTNHEAFGYFAERYGFEVVGVVVPGGTTLAEPSSAELAELVEIMEREEVRVIFAETSQPTALADAVAAEIGDDVEVVELFSESLGEPGSSAATLEEMLLTNAERIVSALG